MNNEPLDLSTRFYSKTPQLSILLYTAALTGNLGELEEILNNNTPPKPSLPAKSLNILLIEIKNYKKFIEIKSKKIDIEENIERKLKADIEAARKLLENQPDTNKSEIEKQVQLRINYEIINKSTRKLQANIEILEQYKAKLSLGIVKTDSEKLDELEKLEKALLNTERTQDSNQPEASTDDLENKLQVYAELAEEITEIKTIDISSKNQLVEKLTTNIEMAKEILSQESSEELTSTLEAAQKTTLIDEEKKVKLAPTKFNHKEELRSAIAYAVETKITEIIDFCKYPPSVALETQSLQVTPTDNGLLIIDAPDMQGRTSLNVALKMLTIIDGMGPNQEFFSGTVGNTPKLELAEPAPKISHEIKDYLIEDNKVFNKTIEEYQSFLKQIQQGKLQQLRKNYLDIARLLLTRHANFHQPDLNGDSAFSLAESLTGDDGVDLIKFAKELAPSKKNKLIELLNNPHNEEKKIQEIQDLISHDPSLVFDSSDQNYPIFIAISKNYRKITDLLIKVHYNHDIYFVAQGRHLSNILKDFQRLTDVEKKQSLNIISFLLKCGDDFLLCDKSGTSPYQLALQVFTKEQIEELISFTRNLRNREIFDRVFAMFTEIVFAKTEIAIPSIDALLEVDHIAITDYIPPRANPSLLNFILTFEVPSPYDFAIDDQENSLNRPTRTTLLHMLFLEEAQILEYLASDTVVSEQINWRCLADDRMWPAYLSTNKLNSLSVIDKNPTLIEMRKEAIKKRNEKGEIANVITKTIPKNKKVKDENQELKISEEIALEQIKNAVIRNSSAAFVLYKSQSTLTLATQRNLVSVVGYLAKIYKENNVSLDIPDRSGKTTLLVACLNLSFSGQENEASDRHTLISIIKILLSNGANVFQASKSNLKQTPYSLLMSACNKSELQELINSVAHPQNRSHFIEVQNLISYLLWDKDATFKEKLSVENLTFVVPTPNNPNLFGEGISLPAKTTPLHILLMTRNFDSIFPSTQESNSSILSQENILAIDWHQVDTDGYIPFDYLTADDLKKYILFLEKVSPQHPSMILALSALERKTTIAQLITLLKNKNEAEIISRVKEIVEEFPSILLESYKQEYPLFVAVERNHKNIFNYFISKIPSDKSSEEASILSLKQNSQTTILHHAISFVKFVPIKDGEKEEPSVKRPYDLDIIKDLLHAEADFFAPDANAITPYDIALKTLDRDAIASLITNAIKHKKSFSILSKLIISIEKGNLDNFKNLVTTETLIFKIPNLYGLEFKDKNSTSPKLATPLHLVFYYKRFSFIEFLASPEFTDKTPEATINWVVDVEGFIPLEGLTEADFTNEALQKIPALKQCQVDVIQKRLIVSIVKDDLAEFKKLVTAETLVIMTPNVFGVKFKDKDFTSPKQVTPLHLLFYYKRFSFLSFLALPEFSTKNPDTKINWAVEVEGFVPLESLTTAELGKELIIEKIPELKQSAEVILQKRPGEISSSTETRSRATSISSDRKADDFISIPFNSNSQGRARSGSTFSFLGKKTTKPPALPANNLETTSSEVLFDIPQTNYKN